MAAPHDPISIGLSKSNQILNGYLSKFHVFLSLLQNQV